MMADSKVSDLTAASALTGAETAHIVQGGVDRKLTLGDTAEKSVGTAAGTVAAGDHLHAGVYEPADATILKDADIGGTVEALGKAAGTNTQTDSYTFALTDIGKFVEMNAATAKVFTIPTNAAVAFVTDSWFHAVRIGAGAVTVAGDAGVTLNGVSAGTITLASRYDSAILYKRGTNEWIAPNYTAV